MLGGVACDIVGHMKSVLHHDHKVLIQSDTNCFCTLQHYDKPNTYNLRKMRPSKIHFLIFQNSKIY